MAERSIPNLLLLVSPEFHKNRTRYVSTDTNHIDTCSNIQQTGNTLDIAGMYADSSSEFLDSTKELEDVVQVTPETEVCPVGLKNQISGSLLFKDPKETNIVSDDDNAPADNIILPPPGTKENPIHLIQEGNTYHSTHVLTGDQVEHVAQVLQHKMANESRKIVGRTVLFNPLTNTRIVYRVIYPGESEEYEKNDNARKRVAAAKRSKMASACREKSRNPRRTRSGRISKPPPYIVKDYRRISHLGLDQDDSSSDYDISDYDGQATADLPPDK